MNTGCTVFAQLIEHLSDKEFQEGVARYRGHRYAKKLTCWEQFLAVAFAQRASRESLRDIQACLGAVGGKLYHMGFASSVARSTLADANENRDWRIFADFAQVLICIARPLYGGEAIGVELNRSPNALCPDLELAVRFEETPRALSFLPCWCGGRRAELPFVLR